MHATSLFFGAYITGLAFTYCAAKTTFDMDRAPEWQKILTSLAVALVWPVPVAITAGYFIKETIFR